MNAAVRASDPFAIMQDCKTFVTRFRVGTLIGLVPAPAIQSIRLAGSQVEYFTKIVLLKENGFYLYYFSINNMQYFKLRLS